MNEAVQRRAPGRAMALPIVTARLVLREFQTSDYDAVYAYASDPRVTRYMLYGARDAADTQEYLARVIQYQRDKPRLVWEFAVTQRADGALIGACDLTILKPGEGDVGYMLRHSSWGVGYGTEIAVAVINAGFGDLALDRVVSTVSTENTRSIHVLEKSGLRWEALYRRFAQAKGRDWDCHLFATSREEWEVMRG